MSRRARLLSAVFVAGLMLGCGDALGPLPSTYRVTTDKHVYDAELMEFDGTLISYLFPHVVYIEFEVENRGDRVIELVQCDWGAGQVAMSAVVPAGFDGGPDPSGCPDPIILPLAPGRRFSATIRVHLLADVAEAGAEGVERVLKLATRAGPIQSPPIRLRFPPG